MGSWFGAGCNRLRKLLRDAAFTSNPTGIAVMLVKKVTYFGKFGFLKSLLLEKVLF